MEIVRKALRAIVGIPVCIIAGVLFWPALLGSWIFKDDPIDGIASALMELAYIIAVVNCFALLTK